MPVTILTALVLLLVSLSGQAAADPGSPSPADLAFLRSLAEPGPPAPALGTPVPKHMTCNASVDCGDGNTAACTGSGVCELTLAGVKCDGNEVRCPNYCSIGMPCYCCDGPRTTFCHSLRGDCQSIPGGIACNGEPYECDCPDCQE